MAFRWAISEALKLELDSVVIESDSLEVISYFLGEGIVLYWNPLFMIVPI